MKPEIEAEIQRQMTCFEPVYEDPGGYVNDHCFVAREGEVHLFHITGMPGKGPYVEGNEVSFGHAVSRDLRQWEARPECLRYDPSRRWEADHIFAPYVFRNKEEYFMFYAGINFTEKVERMCLATSDDLETWAKHPFNPIFVPSRSWAQWDVKSPIWGCCRDPHVVAHPDYGFILYYVTWLKGGQDLVAIGTAVSDDLVHWQDAGPALVRQRAWDFSTTSMESPCVVARGGRYFLFYKHLNETRVVASEDPLRFTEKHDRFFSIAHAAEVFEVRGEWFVSHCSAPLGDLENRQGRTRGLWLARVHWRANDGMPEVRAFE